MYQCRHGAGAETDILKPEPDIEKHQDRRHNDRLDGVRLHFRADRGADCLCRNAVRCHIKIVHHHIRKCLTFFHIQRSRLDDHLIRACHLRGLHIAVPGNILDHRHDLCINLLYAHILGQCHGRRRSAHKIKAVIQRHTHLRLVDPHHDESGNDHRSGQAKKHILPGQEIDRLLLFAHAVSLFALDAQRIQHIDQEFGHKKRGKHGQADTKHQRDREALDRTAAHQVQYDRGNKGRDITVQDRRQRLAETDLDRRLYRLAGRQFLSDPGKNDHIGIHRHTDRQDDTCNTGQGQSSLKGIKQDHHQFRIQAQRQRRRQTGNIINRDHKHHYQCETNRRRDQAGIDRLGSQLGADHIGTQLLQLQFQAADTDR